MIPAVGARRPWTDIPPHLREELAAWLGSPIASAITQPHGFSPGVAVRIACEDGRRCFVKAVAATPNPAAIEYHRREARVLRRLPATAPIARLLHAIDRDGWCVLVLEDVAGTQPHAPWRDAELDRVLAAMRELGELPAPTRRSAGDVLRDHICGWRSAPPGQLDDWSRANLDRLVALRRPRPPRPRARAACTSICAPTTCC